ncbi:MAG: response regulator [Stellaceae bacterium]
MPGNPAKILVVDDDESVLDSAAMVLRSLGHGVAAAQEPTAALALLQDDASITVLLVDIMLAARARELTTSAKRFRPGLKIIFSTGYPEMLLLDREAPDHLVLVRKPWQPHQLQAALAVALE